VTAHRVRASENAWRADFEAAFSEGRFSDAANLYERSASSSEQPPLVLKAAQARLHTDPAAALRILLALRVPASNLRAKAERDLLLAEAFARTNDFQSADQHLGTALESSKKLRDPELMAAVGYRSVRRHLHAEDPQSARGALELARRGTSHRSQLYSLYAETLLLAYEERVADQAQRLIELLRPLNPNNYEFIDVRAWATHTLAALAREIYIPDAIPEIDRHLGGVTWPKDFDHNRFQALRGVAWAKAMQGDYFNAFRHLKQAADVAPSAAWGVVAACDRSNLARSFNEHRWSRVELDQAEQLAQSVDWHATLAEERSGLLLLAELFGDIDAPRSAMYLARYRELGEIKSALYYRHDKRRSAYSQYSTGIVELALRNKRRGLAELREARKVFEHFGYDFRVARCLLAEVKATGNEELLRTADEKLRHYRESWLMAQIRALSKPVGVGLPPMQQKVFEQVCQGKSTAEIAQLLDRSKYTIDNHLKSIFKTFNVSSRTALLAEAVRRGIMTA
jgi:DNA-binding CsgD family transcriptional regulator